VAARRAKFGHTPDSKKRVTGRYSYISTCHVCGIIRSLIQTCIIASKPAAGWRTRHPFGRWTSEDGRRITRSDWRLSVSLQQQGLLGIKLKIKLVTGIQPACTGCANTSDVE
jgi:hypothetical protein